MQTSGQDDINQEENSCAMHEKNAIDLQQKEDLIGSKHASEINQISSATIQGAHGLQKRQISDAKNGDVEHHKEKIAVSPETDKDLDILKQEENSSPRIPSQESNTQNSNPPKVTLQMKDEPSLENPQPRRNLDSVAHSLQSKQEIDSSGVPGDASKAPKDIPNTLNLKRSPDRRAQTSEMGDSEIKGKEEIMSDIVLPLQTLGSASASQSDNTKLTGSARPEKAVKKLHPRRHPDTGGQSSQGNQLKVALSKNKYISTIPEELKPKSFRPTQILYPGNQTLEKKEENCTSKRKEKDSGNLIQASSLGVGASATQSGRENLTYTKKVEKVEKLQPRRNPDPVVQGSKSDAESTPKVSEKGIDEGYNWRKYGQKLVKGNEFIRSYYRCTYPSCQAKKQVEKLHDGCKTDVNYFGKHEHAKPQHAQVTSAFKNQIPELPVATESKNHTPLFPGQGGSNQQVEPTESPCLAIVARSSDAVAGAVSCSSNDDAKDGHPDSKRQKTETTSVDDKPSSDLRHVVRTLSEVDIVNDGYRWRKYGQKLVKGNPNPRSYYRCSNSGCPVKKHVERASHDPKIVITTYEGHHDHDMPLSQPADQSTPIADANTTTTNGDSRSESRENNSVPHEMVAHVSAN